MKRFVVVRHGEYFGQTLTTVGSMDMVELAEALKKALAGMSITLFASSSGRGHESGLIFARILEVPCIERELFWTGPDSPRGHKTNTSAVLAMVLDAGTDVVVLITHLEYSARLPMYVEEKIIKKVLNFPRIETEKGEAWDIDLVKHTCVKFKV